MSDLPTFEAYLPALPSTIMKLLKVDPPQGLPKPIEPILELFPDVKRIILVLIDNLGLFEITYYKPQFIIEKANAMILLATKNPYTLGVLHQLIFGTLGEIGNFHLMRELNRAGIETVMIGRKKDVGRYGGRTNVIHKESDMATWIESAKVINRHGLSMIHFLDFESLYRSKRQEPEELIEKLIKRTDKWIASLYKQAKPGTLMIILGNHGRTKFDLKYQGRVAEWRKASVPVAVLIYKEKQQ